jgi:hypothetical protein
MKSARVVAQALLPAASRLVSTLFNLVQPSVLRKFNREHRKKNENPQSQPIPQKRGGSSNIRP